MMDKNTYLSPPTECRGYQAAPRARSLMPASPSQPAKAQTQINGESPNAPSKSCGKTKTEKQSLCAE